jgi:hypothetical protein
MSDGANDDTRRAATPLDGVQDSVIAHPSRPRSLESSEQLFARGIWVCLKLGEGIVNWILEVGREFLEMGPGLPGEEDPSH